MALYAIGDLHLSFQANKPMDVFGGAWHGYVDKLRQGLSVIGPEDTTVLLGDLTWSMDLEHAVEDFQFIHEILGRKIILKGNHDYWWSTAKKFYDFCGAQGFSDMWVLNNNCWLFGDIALCGTRGWFYEEERHGEQDAKIFRRELLRLETSLKAAGDREKICFLHYPPRFGAYRCQEIHELLKQYNVRKCFYGHLHGPSIQNAFQGQWDNVNYALVSADYLNFRPLKVL